MHFSFLFRKWKRSRKTKKTCADSVCGRWLPLAEPSSGCRGRQFSWCSSWSRGWDPCRPPCCCVTVPGAHGCSGGGRKDAGVTQPSQHSFLWRDRGPGAGWHLVLGCAPPRALRPPCLSQSRSDGRSAGRPGLLHHVCSSGRPRTGIVTLLSSPCSVHQAPCLPPGSPQ